MFYLLCICGRHCCFLALVRSHPPGQALSTVLSVAVPVQGLDSKRQHLVWTGAAGSQDESPGPFSFSIGISMSTNNTMTMCSSFEPFGRSGREVHDVWRHKNFCRSTSSPMLEALETKKTSLLKFWFPFECHFWTQPLITMEMISCEHHQYHWDDQNRKAMWPFLSSLHVKAWTCLTVRPLNPT